MNRDVEHEREQTAEPIDGSHTPDGEARPPAQPAGAEPEVEGAPSASNNGEHRPARVGGAREAMHAVTRLLSVAAELKGPDAVRQRLVAEAVEFFDVGRAVLLAVAVREGRVEPLAVSPEVDRQRSSLAIADFPSLHALLERDSTELVSAGDDVRRLDEALGATSGGGSLLMLPMSSSEVIQHALLLIDGDGREFASEEIDTARAFASAASASLAQMRLAERHASQVAEQAALARAAKMLNESLDLNRVLVRICREAANILDADNAVVYRGGAEEEIEVQAAHGMPPEGIGHRLPPGTGLAGKAAELDRPLLTNEYQAMADEADEALFGDMRSCMAVPMHWDGSLRGVLAVGYLRPYLVTRAHLSLLEAFGELAAAAFRNASEHAGLAHAARTDGLTGCLNHAAMHDVLGREIERCGRTGHRLSMVLVDMDDFKRVNEEHGHLAGDEVLRSVGRALRQAVRPYDSVARYGGDEFAILAIEADETEAAELAERALARVRTALAELDQISGAGSASAGVAEWSVGEAPTELIERADRALMNGKREGEPGGVVIVSQLRAPELAEQEPPSQPRRRYRPPRVSSNGEGGDWQSDSSGREQTERLRRRSRQLSLATALGTRLAAMTDPHQILEATVDELHRAFGYHLCDVVCVRDDGFVYSAARRGEGVVKRAEQGWAQPRSAGLIGRCLRERRPVIVGDVTQNPDFAVTFGTGDVRSELVVPLWVGGELWGAIDLEDLDPNAFDEDDGRVLQTVADQVGSALRSANLYQRLESAYVGTAEALATALEAKDSYTANHSRAVVRRAEQVADEFGLDEDVRRTIRLAAIFHDIGKIAVPEAILNKRGPLTADERREIERHTVVGERILSSVDFLADVLPLVRHEHERWDGKGYPDGLSGESIPLGSRIILACDAYDAMTSDRPYRDAMSEREARAELLRGAGTQFDERVVGVLLQIVDTALSET